MREPNESKELIGARRLFALWKQVGKRIGDMQARALLTLFYFIVLGPFALLVRWREIKSGAPRGWHAREEGEANLKERATKQF